LRRTFERWYPRLVRFLYARLGDADQAEDLAQEAFVRLLRVRPRDSGPWLFTVAANLARDELRLAKGHARHLALISAETAERIAGDPESAATRIHELERVRRALASLPERDRDLLLLHSDGFRYREIAQHVGVAPSSVGPLLTRAQRRFVDSYQTTQRSDAARVAR
jgi:RNA polymerase sigma factor (sigma-70 family)